MALYFWDKGDKKSSGGGLSKIPIYKDGTLSGEFEQLNFTGVGVNISADGIKGNIQIPPSNFPSHFNTSDGNTNPKPSKLATSLRFISNPLGTFNIGSWTPGSQINAINNPTLIYNTVNNFLIDNLTTNIVVNVLGSDDSTIIASNTQTITGNLDNTTNNIRIQILNFNSSDSKYKGQLIVTINIDNILGNKSGRFSVIINHDVSGTIYNFEDRNIFYDKNDLTISMNNPTISENTPIIKYISGIGYYNINSVFNTSLTSINNTNRDTFKNGMFIINGNNFGLPTLTINPSQLTGWTNDYNKDNLNYNNSAWTINTPNIFKKGSYFIQANSSDWIDNPTQNSTPINILLSTYSVNNTRIYEDFRDESRRLLSNFNTLWDSTQDISIYDGGNGLQMINSKLIYPNENFTLYTHPTTVTQKDYSALNGDRLFNTEFNHPNISHSNGIFTFNAINLTETELTNNDFELLISLDKTNWYTLNLPYAGGSLNNGDGCRIDDTTYNLDNPTKRLRFTLGTGKFTNETSGNGWGIFIKIIYKDTINGRLIEIDSINLGDWI